MLDNNQYGWFPPAENSNWSCYYYPDGLPHVAPSMALNGSEGKWSSCSSSSSDESHAGLGPPSAAKSKLRIKKKLRARDRDNEIDYILKRKSLQLCRQSSNGSTSCSDANEALKHKPVLSRQNSCTSIKQPLSRQNSSSSIKPTLSRQNSSSSIKPVLSRQNSSSSMMDSYNSCPSGPSNLLPTTTPVLSQQPSIQQRVVAQLSKSLRSNCDKILDMSVPFILDSCVLWNVAEAVNDLMSTQPDSEDTDYVHQLMFLADVLEQTPSLCITLSDINSIPGNLDLTLFRSLQMLELRKIPPHMVSGLNTIRINLKKLKCTRCLDSLSEIFSANTSAEILPPAGSPNNATLYPVSTLSMTLTSVWPELTEIDVSFNRIDFLDIKALELTPSVQILNLSRNRISSIDCGFSRVLTSLSVLNLNYNQLTSIPPVPPNLKVLHISNNYIATLNCPGVMENLKNLEVLDISQNMISDENQFESLRDLSSLNNLIFIGNPVSYLENYRNKLCGNLHKNVLGKSFILDKKKLSNSEVRYGLEKFKGWRANPMIGPGGALLVGTPGGGSRLSDLRSLTQSYDSNSSSVRSACRKRAKIREVVLLDTENMDPGETKSESGDSADTRSLSDKSMILETKNAIESLRDKYGNDNWLLRQAGCEVGKLLGIPDKVTKLAALSQSLPVSRDSTFYSACAIATLESVGLKASQSYEDSTSTIDNENEHSDESIKQIDDSSEGVYQSCIDGGSIEVNSTDPEDDADICQFQSSLATHFRFFQNGQARDLCILDNFLYEINPQLKEEVLCKWDLKSLKSITEEKSNSDTEAIEFRISFDTLRKQLRERTFIMSKKDYELFNEMASPFLQVRTLQEFADGFQCVKCNAQFSKGMADVKIVEAQDGAPKEVHICPNLECRSDLLIPLEDIPLPNNETFNLAEDFWGATPQRSSTPVSGGLFRTNSLPVPGFFFGSAEKSTPVKTNNRNNNTSNTPTANIGAKLKEAEKPAGQNTKSESDIEVVSCDSSSCSIEVLAKNGDGESISSADIEVEEAVEIPTLEFTLHKNVPMTESNSSGSCTESVCTTYERTPCPTLSISQQLSPNIISTSSCSTSTLTPSSTCSPSHSATGITTPIRYDYDNFAKVDHRLQLFCELSVFKSQDEKLLALTKAMVITPGGACLSIVIFSSKKIYLYKIVGVETDKPDDWLQKSTCFPIGKLLRLEVLIGRQGVCLDFAGKPHAVIFRDSGRTSKFIEFFLCDICAEMDPPPLVQDCSQAQKALMSPTNPISYFGILRYALCEAAGKTYPVSALTVTDEEIFLTADLGWLVNKGTTESVCRKHCRDLSTLRQVECLEIDSTFVKLVFELETHVFWDIYFETEEERGQFIQSLRPLVSRDVPFICLSQPLEP